MLPAAIAIEIDIKTGRVYSAFYGTRCSSLSYDGTDEGGVLNISAAGDNRSYDSRRERLLGYYSAEDLVNVVELKPVRLKVTTVNLVNSETLALNWTSNSRHDNLDVKYVLSFYRDDAKEKLFFTQLDREMMTAAQREGSQMVELELQKPGGDGESAGSIGKWAFPLSYQSSEASSGRFSLVLDGMMDAELMEVLDSRPEAEKRKAAQAYSTSITRLGAVPGLEALRQPLDIYVTIEAQPIYGAVKGEFTEYVKSGEVKSNVENTLFAESGGGDNVLEAEIARFRHLSNIRFCDKNKTSTFRLTVRDLDWTGAGTGMYSLVREGGAPGAPDFRSLRWNSAAQEGTVLDFPSIAMLPSGHALQGGNGSISHLRLGAGSMAEDRLIGQLYPAAAREKHMTRYIGLFAETEGEVRQLTLWDPQLVLTADGKTTEDGQATEAVEDYAHLEGVGILSGRSQGNLEDVAVKASRKGFRILAVHLEDREKGNPAARDRRPAGVGGLAGILAGKDGSGKLVPLGGLTGPGGAPAAGASVKGLTVEGAVTAVLPVPAHAEADAGQTPEELAAGYSYGIGGIFGYVWLGEGLDVQEIAGRAQIQDCRNHADVTGNLFTGGVAGHIRDNVRLDGGSGGRRPKTAYRTAATTDWCCA